MKINLNHALVVITTGILIITSCKKDHNATPTKPGTGQNVYVLGSLTNSNTSTYWKNGVATALQNPVTGGSISANALFVSENNVYVAGSISLGTNSNAVYWKNGVGTVLPVSNGSNNSQASSIFVSGSDIYVGGIVNYSDNSQVPYTTPTATYPPVGNVATVWKNGTATTLPSIGFPVQDNGYTSSEYSDYVSALFVSGSDLYVAGGSHLSVVTDPTSYHFARYWKNGSSTDLGTNLVVKTSDNNGYSAYPIVNSIFVSGSDVYAVGYDALFTAVYWKNGVATFLAGQSVASNANSVFVSGGNVYIAGYEIINGTSYATYWKNGVAVNLTNGTTASGANSIFVSGSDVYVSGFQTINNVTYATYWKNGTAVNLSDNAVAYAIYVE